MAVSHYHLNSKPSLTRQLSDTRRQLALVGQIRDQLERMNATTRTLNDIQHELLYDIADMDDHQLKALKLREIEAKSQLKKLDKRLQMLTDIETNGCQLNVKYLRCKKMAKSNTFMVDNRVVSLDKSGGDIDYDWDRETIDIPEDNDGHTEDNWSQHSDAGTEVSEAKTEEADTDGSDSLYESTKRKAVNGVTRKRLIPERFESFPSTKKSSRRNDARKPIIYLVVLALILSLMAFYLI